MRRVGTFALALGLTAALACQGAQQPTEPSAIPTSGPTAVASGAGMRTITPCAEIPMPADLPKASPHWGSSSRMTSSEDLQSLTVHELEIGGHPAEVEIVARAAPAEGLARGALRQVGDRLVSLRSETGLSIVPPPDSRRVHIRSAAFAVWYELGPACPYFSARLGSAAADPAGLEEALATIIESLPRTAPGATPVVSIALPEAEAWRRIRDLFPTGPVARPTWLPAQADRSQVELRLLRISPTREYEVVYRDAAGAPFVTFRLGPVDEMRGSGVGLCCARGAKLWYEFESKLFNDPTGSGMRRMQWTEQTRTLSFWSERIPGEEMFRTAWSLDRKTAPPNPHNGVRDKEGACASSASPDETIRALLHLTGSSDQAAVFDCYALDAVIANGTSVASWADLPRVGKVEIRASDEFAGRRWVTATWRFTSDPGGAWNSEPTMFFLLGLEDGVWRIFDSGTGPAGPVP